MIILIFNNSLINIKIKRFVKIWITPMIVVLLIARVIIVTDLLPPKLNFHGKEKRHNNIKAVAGELPVIFEGSFQNPSLYRFFTKNEATVLSSIHSRQTQFDIWQKELKYHGKSVFICSNIDGKSKQYDKNGHTFWGFKTDNFQTVNRLKIEFTIPKEDIYAGDTLKINFKIYNPTKFDIDFNHPEFPVTTKIAYRQNRAIQVLDGKLDKDFSILKSGESMNNIMTTVVPYLNTGDCLITLTLDNILNRSKNSDYLPIKILK